MASSSGTITALNQTIIAPAECNGTVVFNVTGTWSATIGIQGTVDGTTFFPVPGYLFSSQTSIFSFTTNQTVAVNCAGLLSVQLIATAFTSGTVNVAWDAGNVGIGALIAPNASGSGSLTGGGTGIVVPVNEASAVVFNITGTWTATLAIQGTTDNVNWFGLNAFGSAATGTGSPAVITTFFGSNGYLIINTGGLLAVRTQCTAFASGTINISWTSSAGTSDALQVYNSIPANHQVLNGGANLMVTATGVAGAAVTLTLPGVSLLFHRIVSLEIEAYTTAARTGGTTPVLVTSTNLPGSPIWTFATAAAVGTTDTKFYNFPYSLVASASNTNTTIVCPATTSVIWRVNVVYYNL